YSITGIHPDFRASSGLVSRPDVVDAIAIHSYNVFGGDKSRLERASFEVLLDGTWEYLDFTHGRGALEEKLHFNTNFQLRGGWHGGGSVLLERFHYDPSLFVGYHVERHTGAVVDTVPFVGTPSLPNLDYVLTINTPQFRHFSGNLLFVWG